MYIIQKFKTHFFYFPYTLSLTTLTNVEMYYVILFEANALTKAFGTDPPIKMNLYSICTLIPYRN